MICPVREEPGEEGGTMTATATQEPEAPEVARITQAEDLPDPVRADIIARRQAGETLAELKTRFGHVDPAVIREVLPPGNARERKAKEAKAEVPKPEPAPRWVTGKDAEDLAERTLAARQVVGRNKLAELLSVTGSASRRSISASSRATSSRPPASPRRPARRRRSCCTASRPPPSTCGPARRA
jgi:hypothetical protein